MSLRYIAESLGLSVTTVSRALAGYDDVAEETRRRVKGEAERIGYVPNVIARRLQKGRTDAIGIVAPTDPDTVSDVYLYSAFARAWARLSELDRDLVLLPSLSDDDDGGPGTRQFRRAIEERRVDGMLLFRTRRDDWRIRRLKSAGIPFVVVGSELEETPEIVAIGVENGPIAQDVLERLSGFGHRRVALVVPEGDFDFACSRIAAYADHASTHGIDLKVSPAHFSEDGGRATTSRLLAESDHPTAVVYFANPLALGGLRAISDSVLVPGRHVSVISYGESAGLRYASPPVTTVTAPIDEMARHAIDVLIGEIEGRPVEPIRRWPMTLIRRQSDGPIVARPVEGAWATPAV